MQKIIIFGANGLVGSYLIRSLKEEGKDVVGVDCRPPKDDFYEKNQIPFYLVDITKPEQFEQLPQNAGNIVVLLSALLPAGMEGYHPSKYLEVNAIGALNVLEYCRKTGVKQILYPQTHSDVFGLWGKGIIDPYAPRALNYNDDHTVYVISKVAAQELIKHYHEAYGISYCIFRCPNIYAWTPDQYYYFNGQKKEVAYRKLIRQAIAGEPIEIWGECRTPRDLVYIKDFIQLMKLAMEKEIKEAIYNVSTGVGTTLEEQIKTIVEVFSPKENPSKIIYKPEIEIIDRAHRYSIDNAVKELGYKPKYFCKEMFEDMKKEMEKLK